MFVPDVHKDLLYRRRDMTVPGPVSVMLTSLYYRVSRCRGPVRLSPPTNLNLSSGAGSGKDSLLERARRNGPALLAPAAGAVVHQGFGTAGLIRGRLVWDHAVAHIIAPVLSFETGSDCDGQVGPNTGGRRSALLQHC